MRRVVLILVVCAGAAAGAVPSFASVSTHSFGRVMQAEYGMAIDGPSGLVVVNGSGVFRTVDGGESWKNVTPRSLRHLVSHVAKVIAIGPRIWLEMEGDDRFGFVPFSPDGGRTWRFGRIAGSTQMSNLVFNDRRDGWVTDTTSSHKHVRYKTTDGGIAWRRAEGTPKIKVPALVSGVSIPTHGIAPGELKVIDAVRAPGGLAWAQATGPATGLSYPTYLLGSKNDGRSWSTVPGP